MGGQKRMTGRVLSEKFVVVPNVTRSLSCKSFAGSQIRWWKFFAQTIFMASSIGDDGGGSEVPGCVGADILVLIVKT